MYFIHHLLFTLSAATGGLEFALLAVVIPHLSRLFTGQDDQGDQDGQHILVATQLAILGKTGQGDQGDQRFLHRGDIDSLDSLPVRNLSGRGNDCP